ncbi:MAG: diguanylate cyclase [Acinetobacter sp.]
MQKYLLSFKIPLLLLVVCCLIGLTLFICLGDPKPFEQWQWVDILGEGGSAVFIAIWLFLVIKSRPNGRITTYLFYGLSFTFFHMWMDTLDEFIRIPKDMVWDAWLESVPFPIGLGLVTMGIFYWHQEQLAITKQMQKRERIFRDHRLFDALTPLADANYFKQQLDLMIQQHQAEPTIVILLDMQDFHQINQKHGFKEGTEILQYISQLLSLNIRPQDLLCRLAGDRFVILLPNTTLPTATQMAIQLRHSVQHCAYYHHQHAFQIPLCARTTCIQVNHDNAQQVLKQLNQQLQQQKFQRHVEVQHEL